MPSNNNSTIFNQDIKKVCFIFSFISLLIGLLVAAGLAMYHTHLAATNQTTYQQIRDHDSRFPVQQQNAGYQPVNNNENIDLFRYSNNPYNEGIIHNLKMFFQASVKEEWISYSIDDISLSYSLDSEIDNRQDNLNDEEIIV